MGNKVVPNSTPAGELATMRAAGTFTPFANISVEPVHMASWLEGTKVQAVSGVEWFCSKEWALGPRVVADSMWFFFIKGTGWGKVGDGQRFEIGPGDLMLIPQGAEHMVRQDAGVAMHLYAVHFYSRVFDGVNLLDLMGFPNHFPKGKGSAISREVSECVTREFSLKAPGWRESMAAEIQRALFLMIREYGHSFKPPVTGGGANELPRLLPAFEWLEKNLEDPALSVTALAQRVHLSEVQFRKLFRNVTGLSPVHFIQKRRVERAGHILRDTQLTLKQVASETGFSDVAFFCRVFKAWTKQTPGEFRSIAGV